MERTAPQPRAHPSTRGARLLPREYSLREISSWEYTNCLRSGDDAGDDADETEVVGYSEPGVTKEACR